jgi:hypothetical protein
MRADLCRAVLALLLAAGCAPQTQQAAAPAAPTAAPMSGAHLPDDEAGRVIARAVAAAGGWERWQAHRDVTFISTMTVFNPIGNVTSETISLHKSPLHQGMKTRWESIGLPDELIFGFDGHEGWMLHDGHPVTDQTRSAFVRFSAISSHFWFGLPFALAEAPGALTYLGPEAEGHERWEKVRVAYRDFETLPVEWIVLYVNADTGLIDRVLCQVTAEFLQQRLWLGKWRDYREWEGIKKERRRTFFPADESGAVRGGMAAEQLTEHVRFDSGYPPELFTKPLAAGGGRPAA